MHTNLTYQPQPALCYISKISALGVTAGVVLVYNIQFKNHCTWCYNRTVTGRKYTIQNHYAEYDDQQVSNL